MLAGCFQRQENGEQEGPSYEILPVDHLSSDSHTGANLVRFEAVLAFPAAIGAFDEKDFKITGGTLACLKQGDTIIYRASDGAGCGFMPSRAENILDIYVKPNAGKGTITIQTPAGERRVTKYDFRDLPEMTPPQAAGDTPMTMHQGAPEPNSDTEENIENMEDGMPSSMGDQTESQISDNSPGETMEETMEETTGKTPSAETSAEDSPQPEEEEDARTLYPHCETIEISEDKTQLQLTFSERIWVENQNLIEGVALSAVDVAGEELRLTREEGVFAAQDQIAVPEGSFRDEDDNPNIGFQILFSILLEPFCVITQE